MHSYPIYVLAAFACAICNGVAAVLQKISADREKSADSLDAHLLWNLFQDKPYIIGASLDLLGWVLTVYAVQHLPIFLVESIIASNIVITALAERMFRHQTIKLRSILAIMVILLGLILLGFVSSTEKIAPVSTTLKWAIIASPIPIGLVGYLFIRGKKRASTIGAAILSGLAFGSTSIIGRIFRFSVPFWHTIYSPLILALALSGLLGILLFSIALQRAQATLINATMTSAQTLVPALVGIIFLGDTARKGMWYLVYLGMFLVIGGAIFLMLGPKSQYHQFRRPRAANI